VRFLLNRRVGTDGEELVALLRERVAEVELRLDFCRG
jgi:hypothetical protein